MPVTLVGGFLVDYVTFTNIQISSTFILLFVYWVFAGVVITFEHLYDAGYFRSIPRSSVTLRYFRLFAPLAVQFAFGSLLGASLIFYWFGGAFAVSWPVMAVLVLLLVSNETFRSYFDMPLVQISVYFFASLSLLSFFLPFLFASLSAWLFVAAGAVSLAVFALYIFYLPVFAIHLYPQRRPLFISVIAIAAVMNLLYFTNFIPPIPLALREAGMYHTLQSNAGKYVMQGEPEDFWESLQATIFGQTVHVTAGEKIYLYTAIFAPAKLKTTIVHSWQYYDEAQKDWVNKGDLPFTINGGRTEGYKSYSYQSNLTPGRWRVSVENQRGQVLARVRFTVEKVDAPVELQEVIR